MSCETFVPMIALHSEGDLPGNEIAAVEAHLTGCASCRDFAASLQDSQSALKDLAADDLDPTALAAVRQGVRRSLDRRARQRTAGWLFAAAAGIAALALAFGWSRDRRPTGEPSIVAAVATPAPSLGPVAAPAGAMSATAAPVPVTADPEPRPASLEPELPRVPDQAHALAADAQSSIVIKLETSNPDVVIYWLVDSNGGTS